MDPDAEHRSEQQAVFVEKIMEGPHHDAVGQQDPAGAHREKGPGDKSQEGNMDIIQRDAQKHQRFPL
jgi:hypothetical protein